MGFFVEKVILHNRAPFEHIELDFNDAEIAVLTAINGGGKTTVISHIVDAWYEMAKIAFPGEFSDKEGQYYRIESPLHSLNGNVASLVYIRFRCNGNIIDYVDIKGKCDQSFYDNTVDLDDKIHFSDIRNGLEHVGSIKMLSTAEEEELRKIINNNLVTSFPSYRYEEPGYLNDPFRIKMKYGLQARFSGRLINPIEVISGLPELANWILDIVLDSYVSRGLMTQVRVLGNINKVFSGVLSGRIQGSAILGVGLRYAGAARVQISKSGPKKETVYPSIFNMSSGENAVVCIFGELIKQFDRIAPGVDIEDATGIVIVDEIDKHLHIRIQKEVIPKLVKLFPKVQFIISSHSPFITMGLAEQLSNRTRILDLGQNGIPIKLEQNAQYQEVYKMMVAENDRFLQEYEKIKTKSDMSGKLLIVSEGDNIRHIKKAIQMKSNTLLERVTFLEGLEGKTGVSQLLQYYEFESRKTSGGPILFVFDFDAGNKVNGAPADTKRVYKFAFAKNEENTKIKKRDRESLPRKLIWR